MSNEQAPECCPFCGAGPTTEGEEKWSSEIGKYRCGTISHAFEPDDRWQTSQCRIAERERLTRERDEAREERDQALMLLGVYKTRSGDLLARVKRLEEAGDALQRDKQAFKKALADLGVVGSMGFGSTVKWAQAKEATPSTSPIVGSVEEVSGGMGEDYAVVVLRSGHAIEVSAEGVVAWPSREAQRRADNSDVIDGISFRRKKEATP